MFKKTYLSRAMTRVFSMDGPVGDPFGGPAFGERNEPVTAFFAVATAFETIAAIGAVVSVVGMVTGSEDLTKIGGVMGLVGGFGAMAQSGIFGTGMQEWAQGINESFASSAASNISSAAVPTDAVTTGTIASESMAGNASASNAIDVGSLNLEQAVSAADTSGMLSPADAGLISEPNMLAADAAAGAQPLSADAVTGVQSAATNPALDTVSAATGEPSLMSRVASPEKTAAAVKASQAGIDTGENLFDKILRFGKENKEISQVALTGIAGMYQSSEKAAALDAQARASNSSANLYDARTAEMQTQQNNANAIPGVQGFSVNRNAPIYNKAPVVAAGVTPAGLIQTRRV